MTIYDEIGGAVTWTWTENGNTSEAPTGTAWLRPGKKYTMSTAGNGSGSYFWFSFINPQGYALYVNGTSTDMISMGYQTTFSDIYTIELRPVAMSTPPPCHSASSAASSSGNPSIGKSAWAS